jgi:hypothetical protein
MVTLRKSDWDEYKEYVAGLELEVQNSRMRIQAYETTEREEQERKKLAPAWVKAAPARKRKWKFPWEVMGILAVNILLFVANVYMLSQTVPLVPHGLVIVGVLVFGLIALIVITRGTFTKSVIPGTVMTLLLIVATVVTQGLYDGKISADPDEYVVQVTTPKGGLPPYTLTILDETGTEKQRVEHTGIEAYYRVLPSEVEPQDTIVIQTSAPDSTCSVQLDGKKLLEAAYTAPGPLECRYTVLEAAPATPTP